MQLSTIVASALVAASAVADGTLVINGQTISATNVYIDGSTTITGTLDSSRQASFDSVMSSAMSAMNSDLGEITSANSGALSSIKSLIASRISSATASSSKGDGAGVVIHKQAAAGAVIAGIALFLL